MFANPKMIFWENKADLCEKIVRRFAKRLKEGVLDGHEWRRGVVIDLGAVLIRKWIIIEGTGDLHLCNRCTTFLQLWGLPSMSP